MVRSRCQGVGQRCAGGGGQDGSAPAVHGSCCHSPVASQDPASVQSPLSVESLCPSRCGSLPAVGPGMVAQAQAAQGAAVLEIQRARGSEGPTPRGHPLPARSSVSLPSPNGDHPPRVPWRRDLGLPLSSPASVIASGPRPPMPPQPTPKTE